jgi:hypothetical protein
MPWEQPISLAILGAEKAGTTALFRHLSQSPLLQSHPQREMTCFVNNELWARGEAYARQQYYAGSAAGLRLMKDVMLMNFPEGLRRLQQSSPDVRVIVMLREPAARAWSAYNYARSRGVESAESFAAALALENERARTAPWAMRTSRYVFNSTYADKVAAILRVFGPDRTLVMYQSEYRERPVEYLDRISSMLDCELYPEGLPDFVSHNRAAQARSQVAAAGMAKLFRSQGPVKRALRAVVPQRLAIALRHGLLSLNRVERPNGPIPEREAQLIRRMLADDGRQLVELLGRCPWVDTEADPAEPD